MLIVPIMHDTIATLNLMRTLLAICLDGLGGTFHAHVDIEGDGCYHSQDEVDKGADD